MHVWVITLLVSGWVSQAPTSPTMLGAGGLAVPDARAARFELDFLQALNQQRPSPLAMDERLRLFARDQAQRAVRGTGSIAACEAAIKGQHMASGPYRLRYAASETPQALVKALKKDAAEFFSADLSRAGVGAVWVPSTPPRFQVVLLLVQDPDPMQGKPGLSLAQTDPVMLAAQSAFTACYDQALKDDPNLRGDVVMRLLIGPGGHPQGVNLLRGLHVPAFDACLTATAQGLLFPAPYKDRPVTLMSPLRFTPPQGNARIGVLTGEQIQSAFARAAPDLLACYDSLPQMTEKARPTGSITLSGVVQADGAWKNIDVLFDEPHDAQLTQCVLARASQVHFAVPRGGGEVPLSYPVRFGL